MEELKQSRSAIDEIDRQLLALLARRMETVRSVAKFKRENEDAPLHDPDREHKVFEFWSREGESLGLSTYFVGRILKELLAYLCILNTLFSRGSRLTGGRSPRLWC